MNKELRCSPSIKQLPMKMNPEDAENLREVAARWSHDEETKRKTDPEETHERSIIIIGSKGIGKTTMVYKFLEKDDAPKSTIAMDYSFGRKAGKSLVKEVVHVWEVGHLASSLISAAMTGSALTHSPNHTTLIIMLDLSKPEVLWSTLEESLSVARSAMKMSYAPELVEDMIAWRGKEKKKVVEKAADTFPMKMCIVGGKYDQFKEFELYKKQHIGRTLRAVAQILGADLQYHSSKDSGLVRKTKDLLSHYGFGSHAVKGVCMDYEKALVIPAGTDSLASIDLKFPSSKSVITLDTIKQSYIARIPQGTKDEDSSLEDPANDPNFNEAIIDRLRMQREEEISVLLRDMLEGRSPKIPIPEPC